MNRLFKTVLAVQFLAAFLGFSGSAGAVTLNELRNMPGLTPEMFGRQFADFEYKFHTEVQTPTIFLGSKSGDCDDYATVAADVLARHGYTPRLVAIRMKGEVHVVCYIEETKSYLDYNFRKEKNPTIPSDGSLTDIATKVARSFDRDWVATYEFSFRQGVKRLVNNILPNPSFQTAARN